MRLEPTNPARPSRFEFSSSLIRAGWRACADRRRSAHRTRPSPLRCGKLRPLVRSGSGRLDAPLLGRSALQLIEDQLAMLLEYAEGSFRAHGTPTPPALRDRPRRARVRGLGINLRRSRPIYGSIFTPNSVFLEPEATQSYSLRERGIPPRQSCLCNRRFSWEISKMAALNINGQTHQVDVDPNTPLLWALRDTIGLTGTKYAAVLPNAAPAPCTWTAWPCARARCR